MRAKNRKVRVVAFLFLVTVTVDDCQIVVVVLLRHESAGVLAEDTHFVLERFGITDEFGLVKHIVDFFHNLVAHFDSHADVDDARCVRDVVFGAHLFKPVRAASARCDNGFVRKDFLFVAALAVFDIHAFALVAFQNDVGALSCENEVNTVISQIVFDCKVQIVRFFRAEVTNGAIDQFQSCLNCFFADFFDFFLVSETFDMLVRTEFEIYFVGVIDEFLRLILADELRKFAADFV